MTTIRVWKLFTLFCAPPSHPLAHPFANGAVKTTRIAVGDTQKVCVVTCVSADVYMDG